MILQRDAPSPEVRARRAALRRRLARLVTEVFAPSPLCAALLVAVAVKSAPTVGDAVRWGLLAACFASAFPFLYILRGVRRRRLSDHHVGVREQRPALLVVFAAVVLLGTAVLAVLGAPRPLVALIAAMAAGLVVSLGVTLVWKISVHAATAAGAAVILLIVFGPSLWPFLAVPPLVGWSRVEVRDHTPAQVVAGMAMGAAVAAVVFLLLR
jgi:membrane-associated phospholipid phosphatase